MINQPSLDSPTEPRLKDRVCIITGSSSGLGRAIALAFAAQGCRFIVCADLNALPKSRFMAEEAGTPTHEVICSRHGENKALFVKTNVTVSAEVEALVQTAVEKGGRLDVIVNNAGMGGTENHGPIHELAEEDWDKVMNINSRSVFLGCKFACAQFLKQTPRANGHRGWIVNTSSIMGLDRRRVNIGLTPIDLRTPMTEAQFENQQQRAAISALTPWGDEWGAAEDVAKGYVYLASDDAAYVTGVALPIDGGYCAQ
ncbi:MAG: hypothetical protein Q9170_003363 [Blastenia crenularia]